MSRALLVIDAQMEYVTGRLPITYPPLAVSIAAIGRTMDLAVEHGVVVVAIQHDNPVEAAAFAVGSPMWELHAVVADRPTDLTVHKTLPSAFVGTGLGTPPSWLRCRAGSPLSELGRLPPRSKIPSLARYAESMSSSMLLV